MECRAGIGLAGRANGAFFNEKQEINLRFTKKTGGCGKITGPLKNRPRRRRLGSAAGNRKEDEVAQNAGFANFFSGCRFGGSIPSPLAGQKTAGERGRHGKDV